jgi:hypothetical protein
MERYIYAAEFLDLKLQMIKPFFVKIIGLHRALPDQTGIESASICL